MFKKDFHIKNKSALKNSERRGIEGKLRISFPLLSSPPAAIYPPPSSSSTQENGKDKESHKEKPKPKSKGKEGKKDQGVGGRERKEEKKKEEEKEESDEEQEESEEEEGQEEEGKEEKEHKTLLDHLLSKSEPLELWKTQLAGGENYKMYAQRGIPLFLEQEGHFFPSLYALRAAPQLLPGVQTHPFVFEKLCQGADLMLPGIIFPKGQEQGLGLVQGQLRVVFVPALPASASSSSPVLLPVALGRCLVSDAEINSLLPPFAV